MSSSQERKGEEAPLKMSAVDEEQPLAAKEEEGHQDDDSYPQQQPFITRMINSDYYTKSERLAINFYTLLLLVEMFIPDSSSVTDDVRLILFFVLIVAPSAFVFLPLDIMFLQCFTKQQLMKHVLKWKLLLGEQIMRILIILSIIPVLYGYIVQNGTILFYSIRATLTVTIFYHIMSFLLIDAKRMLLAEADAINKRKEKKKADVKYNKNEKPYPIQRVGQQLNKRRNNDNSVRKTTVMSAGVSNAIVPPQLVDDEDQEDGGGGDNKDETKKELSNFAGLGILLSIYRYYPLLSLYFFGSTLLAVVFYNLVALWSGKVVSAFTAFTDDSNIWDVMEPALYLVINQLLITALETIAVRSGVTLQARIDSSLKTLMFSSVCGCSTGSKTDTATETEAQTMNAGDLVSRFSEDATTISTFMYENMYYDVLDGLVGYASSVAILATLDGKMAFFFAVCVPCMVVVNIHSQQQDGDGDGDFSGRLAGRFQNLVRLRRYLNLYQAGDFVWSKTEPVINKDFDKMERDVKRGASLVSQINGTMNIYVSLLYLAMVLSSIENVRNGAGSQVEIVAVGLGIIGGLYYPVSAISRAGQNWLQVKRAIDRMEIFTQDGRGRHSKPNHHYRDEKDGAKADLESGVSNTNPEDGQGELFNESLELKGIQYQYPGAETPTLKGVDAKFNAGKYFCIIGGSGAGKSTLLNILTRELVETGGDLLLDGRQNTLNVAQFRKNLGVVLQESAFFDGSISDNIRIGKPNATDEEIQEALDRSQCSQFVSKLPDGMHTQLGGENVNVSGGQAQRISLARALIRKPTLLILDEATSALDPVTEKAVIKTVKDLAVDDNVTSISVTHRLDTTDTSDEIFVLKDGIVFERGSPAKLNVQGTLFSEIRGNEPDPTSIAIVEEISLFSSQIYMEKRTPGTFRATSRF